MSGAATPHSPSDPSDKSSTDPFLWSKGGSLSHTLKETNFSVEPPGYLDESHEFHDPFSDLNLFLARKIKEEMGSFGEGKKWSSKIQQLLIEKITPEFQKKFPKYRLGVSALKKTWEKILHYSQQLQDEKEAMTQDGKLNISFFIKENLKQYSSQKRPSDLHPYHWANKLALKISECIATLEGVRPKTLELTKLTWAVQRHLIKEEVRSPYDEHDKADKLIVKMMLEIIAKEPKISQVELEHAIKEAVLSLHQLPSFSSNDKMTAVISSLLAEKLYATSLFHSKFLSHQKEAISHFIERQITLCKTAYPKIQHIELVRRVVALYALASHLPKTLSQDEVRSAIDACYPVLKSQKPAYPQALYAFIAAESVLMKTEEYCHCANFVKEAIASAYQEAALLPHLNGKESEILELVIWKILSESEETLKELPYLVGHRIEEEIAGILIENPTLNFGGIVHLTVQFFQKAKELSLSKKWEQLEGKIHIWSQQGDLVLRTIQFDQDSPLLKLVTEKWKKSNGAHQNIDAFVSEISLAYLKQYPQLSIYLPQLTLRIMIFYKHVYYTLSSGGISSFEAYLKWHMLELKSAESQLSHKEITARLKEISEKCVPLLPFDSALIA